MHSVKDMDVLLPIRICRVVGWHRILSKRPTPPVESLVAELWRSERPTGFSTISMQSEPSIVKTECRTLHAKLSSKKVDIEAVVMVLQSRSPCCLFVDSLSYVANDASPFKLAGWLIKF